VLLLNAVVPWVGKVKALLLPNARCILKRGPSLSTYKLLLMAAASTRPGLRSIFFGLLRPFIHNNDVTIRYRREGRLYSVFIRMDDVFSDFCSVLELVVKHVYKIDSRFVPDLVVDCGGNTGLFSLEASALYPSARIVVCEPAPRNLDRIRRHLSFNSVAAEVLPVCVGGSRRIIPFYLREANQGSFESTKPYTNKLDVEVLTLADLLRNRRAHTLYIKLDIEGMEIEALETYVPGETRAVCVVGELHGHKDNSRHLERIFGDHGWQLKFEDVSDAGSIFEAYSPAALDLLRRGPTSNSSPGRSSPAPQDPPNIEFP
jgi:FkbM family methyltransferase